MIKQMHAFQNFMIELNEVRPSEFEVNYYFDQKLSRSYNFADYDHANDCFSYIKDAVLEALWIDF